MMTKERMELLFIMLFAYVRMVRQRKLKEAADALRSKVIPRAEDALKQAKTVLPVISK